MTEPAELSDLDALFAAPAPPTPTGVDPPVRDEPPGVDLGWTAKDDEPIEQLPEQDTEAELAVLGAMLLDRSAADTVSKILTPRDFYRGPHGDTFAVMLQLLRESTDDLDIVRVRNALEAAGQLHRVGGAGFLSRIMSGTPTAANAKHYADMVRAKSYRRLEKTRLRQLAKARTPREVWYARTLLQAVWNTQNADDVQVPQFGYRPGFELMQTEFPPTEWLVEDGLVFRGGLTHLAAPQKRGKSLVGLALALSLVRAMTFPDEAIPDWLGSNIVGSGPTMLLSGEGGAEMIQARINILEPNLGDQLNNLHVFAEAPYPCLSRSLDLGVLTDFAIEHGVVCLIVDPLSRFWSLEDEASAVHTTDFMKKLREAARLANMAVVTIHHDSKGESTPGELSGGRGSSVLANEVDTLINLRRDREGDRKASEVYFEVRHGNGPDPCKVTINPDTLHLDFVTRLGSAATASGVSNRGRKSDYTTTNYAEALRTYGDWMTRSQWATAVGCSLRQLENRLRAGMLDEMTGVEAAKNGKRNCERYRWLAA